MLQRWKTPGDLAAELIRSQTLVLPVERMDPADVEGWLKRGRKTCASAGASAGVICMRKERSLLRSRNCRRPSISEISSRHRLQCSLSGGYKSAMLLARR